MRYDGAELRTEQLTSEMSKRVDVAGGDEGVGTSTPARLGRGNRIEFAQQREGRLVRRRDQHHLGSEHVGDRTRQNG